MRPLSILLVLIVIVVGLGFYLGWFGVSSHSETDQTKITLSVDKSKIEADRDKVVDKVQALGNKALATTAPSTQKSDENARPEAPSPKN